MINFEDSQVTALSLDELLQLERDLGRLQLHGIAVGSTIRNNVTRKLALGYWPPGGTSLAALLSLARTMVCPWKLRRKGPRPPERPILVTWLNPAFHGAELVLPVLRQLDPSQVLVLGAQREMELRLPAGTAFMSWDDLPFPSPLAWYGTVAIRLHLVLAGAHRIASSRGMAWRGTLTLASVLLAQMLKLSRAHHFVRGHPVKVVLTEFDRHENVAPLVLAAKSLGVETITMIHGLLNDGIGYAPPLADRVLCWGQSQHDELLALGTGGSELIVTGCQRLKRSLAGDRAALRNKLGIASGDRVVLLATNPIERGLRVQLAEEFCKAVRALPGWVGIVRPHPSESIETYVALVEKYPGVYVLDNDQLPFDDALALADVVTAHNSGLTNDALVHGIPAVVFDVLPLPLLSTKALVDKRVVMVAKSAGDLRKVLGRLGKNKAERDAWRQAAVAYGRSHCAVFGDDAAGNVASVVREALTGGAAGRVQAGNSEVVMWMRPVWWFFQALRGVWWRVSDRYLVPSYLRCLGVKLGRGVRFSGWPIVRRCRGSDIVLGDSVYLNSRLYAHGGTMRVKLWTNKPGSQIILEERCALSGTSIVCQSRVRIGKRTLVGSDTCIWDSDFHPLDPDERRADRVKGALTQPVEIGDDVFIGLRAVILKGVTLGEGAVIGAGAVVSRDVPSRVIVAGNPAKVVRPVKAGSQGDKNA